MYIFKVLLSATSFFQTFILRCVVYLFTGAVLLLWLMCLCLIFIILKTFIQSNAGLVGRLSAQKNKPAFPPCYPREVGGPKLLLPWELSLIATDALGTEEGQRNVNEFSGPEFLNFFKSDTRGSTKPPTIPYHHHLNTAHKIRCLPLDPALLGVGYPAPFLTAG